MNKWNGTGWDKISGEAQDFDYNSLTNKPSINGTTLQGNVVFDFITEDDLSELNTLIDELEARIGNIENGTTIIPNANSSFYSFVANSATNAHLVDGKEISEWTAGTVWTCTYNNGVITLPEGKELSQGNIQPIQFIAPTASSSLTTLTINSQSYTIKMQDGSEVPENLWATNSVVFAVVSEDQKTINFKSGGGLSLDALTNPAAATDILKNKQAYDDEGNLLTGTILTSSGEQGTVANIDLEIVTDHTTYGNITSNGIYKISLTPGLSRYVNDTAIWPTYIDVDVNAQFSALANQATASQILSGRSAYNNIGTVINGNITDRSGTTQSANGSNSGNYFRLQVPNTGYYSTNSYLQISKTSALNIILPAAPSGYQPASASNIADGYYAYNRSGTLLRGTADFSNLSSSSSTHVEEGYYAYTRQGVLIRGTGTKITTATLNRTLYYYAMDSYSESITVPRNGTAISLYISPDSTLSSWLGIRSRTIYPGDSYSGGGYIEISLSETEIFYSFTSSGMYNGEVEIELTYQY